MSLYEPLVVAIFEMQAIVLTAFPMLWMPLVGQSTVAKSALFLILPARPAAFDVMRNCLFTELRCVCLVQ
jgi:hypothetical protein